MHVKNSKSNTCKVSTILYEKIKSLAKIEIQDQKEGMHGFKFLVKDGKSMA